MKGVNSIELCQSYACVLLVCTNSFRPHVKCYRSNGHFSLGNRPFKLLGNNGSEQAIILNSKVTMAHAGEYYTL